MSPATRPLELTLYALIAGAVAVVLSNFLSFRSLWLDEAMLALNLVDRSFAGLLAPLDLLQVAPIGFLWLEKAALLTFGPADWALRIVPLLAYAVSVPLLYALARRVLESRPPALLAAAVYANAYAANYYATELKQYMSDGLVAIALLLAGLAFAQRRSLGSAVALGAFGVGCIWLSNVAVITLFTTGLYLLYLVRAAGLREGGLTVLPIGLWLLGFCGYYAAFIHGNPNQPGMVAYWEPFGVFLPYDVTSAAFWEQLWFKVQVTAKLICQYRRFSLPLFLLVAYGGWAFAKTSPRALYLLAAPAAVHLVLSYLKLYPFEVRMVLYLLPAVSILLAKGIAEAYRQTCVYLPRVPATAMAVVPVLLFGLNLRTTDFEVEEVKQALDHLALHAEADDVVYVYFKAQHAAKFYLRDYPELAARATFVYGTDGERDWRHYEHDIRGLREVDWLLFTGPPDVLGSPGLDLEGYFLCLVGESGTEKVDERHFTGASVFELGARRAASDALKARLEQGGEELAVER